MKKIMFNDKYCLTEAVLEGRKTMTRRLVRASDSEWDEVVADTNTCCMLLMKTLKNINKEVERSRFSIDEIVAVAQNYTDVYNAEPTYELQYALTSFIMHYAGTNDLEKIKGFDNKMFVRADLMPHQIRITNIKVERLQDISNEDCLKEGIYKDVENGSVIGSPFGVPFFYTFYGAISKKTGKQLHWTTPREAFSVLINKISGKGTWEKNPWEFAYEFELIK